ncbi:MAG: hypothetical protein KDA81_10040 [Planctomycetaceae bacterium]|nr:hypothetical protein [Planctomycetaceae bacterium]
MPALTDTVSDSDTESRVAEREREARLRAERYLQGKSIALNLAKEELKEKYAALEQAHRQLVQSEKMASLGQLAAGVAHEINNPVGFVTSNLNTLSEYLTLFREMFDRYACLEEAVLSGEPAVQQQLISDIRQRRDDEDMGFIMEDIDSLLTESADGLQRVSEIVRNLKSFVRLDESKEQLADINEGLESTLKIVWNELKYKCQVQKRFGALPRIRCCASELNQVFMNLMVNAAQAIEEHGTIVITTEATETDILIHVSDSGRGIPPENMDKLFTPFFTTKPVGSGTGLGLSVSYGIIEKHHGSIDVQSTVGEGTTFTVRLPICSSTDPATSPTGE